MLSIRKKILALVCFCCISLVVYAQERAPDKTPERTLEKAPDSLTYALHEIVIVNKDPIAEKFSSTKLTKLDVYFNPASNGDPLKAIAILPMSTASSETANPILRGALADQSRVYVNGSPILNPVRHAQDTGLGNFSLFNIEMIENQYIYAANPPLTYGNASGGLVDIKTTNKLETNSYQIATALSNVGLQVNRKIGKENFFQYYANVQFSDLLKKVNGQYLSELNSFQSKDMGFNIRLHVSPQTTLNSYTYYVDEKYDSKNYNLKYIDDALANQTRLFTVNSLEYIKRNSLLRISSLWDWSQSDYAFKTINSKSKYQQFFLSTSHKYRLDYGWNIQYGIDFSTSNYTYNEVNPQFYYAMDKQHPTVINQEKNNFHFTELYLYTDYKFTPDFGVSLGGRKSILAQRANFDFLSGQLAAFYKVNKKEHFILGVGNYHSYSTPNYYQHEIHLFTSKQITLDYYYETRTTSITAAIYLKADRGALQLSSIEEINKQQIGGLETSFTQRLGRCMSFYFSNTVVYTSQEVTNQKNKNGMYFIKTQFTYSNPNYFTASLVGTTHPGSVYTKIKEATYDPSEKVFVPLLREYANEKLNHYFRIDFTMNKILPVYDNILLVYCSITNLLNRKNNRSPYYSEDYSKVGFQNFQQRVLYFGLQFKF